MIEANGRRGGVPVPKSSGRRFSDPPEALAIDFHLWHTHDA